MESENAVGSKTARACDGCIKKRARWYCAADDAFLCQACDGSIHSANPLAERHQRVRLKTGSTMQLSINVPAWHYGFTRKPRTPRQKKGCRRRSSDMVARNLQHLVPELVSNNDNSFEDNDQEHEQEQPIYQVPIFDDTFDEMSFSGTSNESLTIKFGKDIDEKCKVGFCESDMDLEEFAADVENLLCKGLDDQESFDLETLGLKDLIDSSSTAKMVKFEEDEEMRDGALVNYNIEDEFNMTREAFELNFDDYDSPENIYEDDDQKIGGGVVINDDLKQECEMVEIDHVEEKKSKILLALDYERVLEAWPEQKSAWLTGDRPEIEVKCWPDCMGECGNVDQITHSEISGMRISDGGREARVSRYREKRRSRLFSKKIRYEVRKLNAEKRPRIKGRFVKREYFAAPSSN